MVLSIIMRNFTCARFMWALVICYFYRLLSIRSLTIMFSNVCVVFLITTNNTKKNFHINRNCLMSHFSLKEGSWSKANTSFHPARSHELVNYLSVQLLHARRRVNCGLFKYFWNFLLSIRAVNYWRHPDDVITVKGWRKKILKTFTRSLRYFNPSFFPMFAFQ